MAFLMVMTLVSIPCDLLKVANLLNQHSFGFDVDFLELALQFGMIMMFACAFPLLFCFAALVYVVVLFRHVLCYLECFVRN